MPVRGDVNLRLELRYNDRAPPGCVHHTESCDSGRNRGSRKYRLRTSRRNRSHPARLVTTGGSSHVVRKPAAGETRIPQIHNREPSSVEEVPAAERETEGRLRNVVPAIASALRPGAMIGRPVLRTALLEGRVPWAVRYTLLRLLLPGLLSMLLWLLEGLACLSSCFPPSSPFCAYTEKHGDPGYFDEFMFVATVAVTRASVKGVFRPSIHRGHHVQRNPPTR